MEDEKGMQRVLYEKLLVIAVHSSEHEIILRTTDCGACMRQHVSPSHAADKHN